MKQIQNKCTFYVKFVLTSPFFGIQVICTNRGGLYLPSNIIPEIFFLLLIISIFVVTPFLLFRISRLTWGGKDGQSKRQFFSYVKTKTKSRAGVGPLRDETDRTVSGDKEMSELLNAFFASVFTREDTSRIPSPKEERMDRPVLTARITAEKVRKKVKRLRAGSAAGPDGLGPQLLQKLIDQLEKPSCHHHATVPRHRPGPGRLEKGKCYTDLQEGLQSSSWQLQTCIPNIRLL